MNYELGMNHCRRCGATLTHTERFTFVCDNGHTIFYNSGTAVVLAIFNGQGQILVTERAGVAAGLWDLPGGFCEGAEKLDGSLEAALEREVREEAGLEPTQYTKPEYLGSGINTYHFGGETVPVIVTLFRAELKSGAKPKAGDDAARVWFADLQTLDLDKLYSATSRRILAELRMQRPAA